MRNLVGVTYRSIEVCRIAGISYRQLDYWTRCGVLLPPMAANGSGTQRAYSELELNVACVCAQLAKVGAGIAVMAEVSCTLRFMWEMEEVHGLAYVDPAGTVTDEPTAACWCIDLDAALASVR